MSILVFKQSTGELTVDNGLIGNGWAGNDYNPEFNPGRIHGKNNPLMQRVHNIGPLPQGFYTLGPWEDHHEGLGPLVAPLVPDGDTEMYGRNGFYCHGPSFDVAKQGNESRGCVVTWHNVRQHIKDLGVTRLQVIP